MNLKRNLDEFGYVILKGLISEDLEQIKALISQRFIEVAKSNSFYSEGLELENYNHFTDSNPKINHSNVWSKIARCLTIHQVNTVQDLPFFHRLQNYFGSFTVTDEESLGYANIYFRLVRPGSREDFGPLHRDKWFWDLSGVKTKTRTKIWIPIMTNYESPFLFVPRSHLQAHYTYEIVNSKNGFKPRLTTKVPHDHLSKFGNTLGDAILFHDELLHGGNACKSGMRVSLEFTMEANY